jgi:glycerol-3-phosphate dehydrogenase
MDAAHHGAEVKTRTPLTGARREGDEWLLETPTGPLRARALVNAAGPSVLDVQGVIGEPPGHGMRLVRGSHIVTRKLFDHDYAYFFQLPDGRLFFAIPYRRDFTLIGTTDADHSGPPGDVSASSVEIAYLCEGVNRHFKPSISPTDVVWSYAGVRALVDDGSGKPEVATRGYRLELSADGAGAPLLSVYGGKITTYRHLSEEAVSKLGRRLPALAGPAWTTTKPLPGGDFPVDGLAALQSDLAARYPFLLEDTVQRIAPAYGTCAWRWLGQAKGPGDLGRDFGGGLTEVEVDYLRREEWAQTAEDILWRRTKLGLHLAEAQQAALADYLDL